MAGVPEQDVTRGVELTVQRERQLDDAEVRREMAAVLGDRFDDERADLVREAPQLVDGERAKIVGRCDQLEERAAGDSAGHVAEGNDRLF